MVEGHGQVEEGLENAVEVGRIKEIDATDDFGDSLESVVDDNGEVVAGADVLADEDDITEELGPGGLLAVMGIGPGEAGSDEGKGFFEIETEGVGRAGGEAGGAFLYGEAAAGAGINGAFTAVGGVAGALDLTLDVGAGAEAGVKQPPSAEAVGGGGEVGAMFALEADGRFPFEAEPGEVLENLLRVLAGAAGRVDVLDAEENLAAVAPGE